MAVLNAWQRIDRVLPGKPFGDGADGDATISSSAAQSQTKQGCSGAANQKNLTIASGAFTNGDVVLIHQTRGNGGQFWEINQVVSGGGSTTLVMKENLHYTYTDSGANQAQVIKIPRYLNLTVNTGVTWSAPSWDTSIGGWLLAAVQKTYTQVGNLDLDSKGHQGGGSSIYGRGASAEGTDGASYGSNDSTANQNMGNGGGGGGGGTRETPGGGAGGGNAAAGTGGQGNGSSQGGDAVGAADLTTIALGGGGGGGGGGFTNPTSSAAGATGGGIAAIFAKTISISGYIYSRGGTGGQPAQGDGGAGGGGAGGSILLVCNTAAIGTNLLVATGGAGGTNGQDGGAGSVGRIAIHHSGTVTGTSNPAFTDVSDATLVEGGPAGGPIFFQGGGIAVA